MSEQKAEGTPIVSDESKLVVSQPEDVARRALLRELVTGVRRATGADVVDAELAREIGLAEAPTTEEKE